MTKQIRILIGMFGVTVCYFSHAITFGPTDPPECATASEIVLYPVDRSKDEMSFLGTPLQIRGLSLNEVAALVNKSFSLQDHGQTSGQVVIGRINHGDEEHLLVKGEVFGDINEACADHILNELQNDQLDRFEMIRTFQKTAAR